MRAIGIAVFAVCFLAVVYAAFDLRRLPMRLNLLALGQSDDVVAGLAQG